MKIKDGSAFKFIGLLCVAGLLQGVPVVYATQSASVSGVTQQAVYRISGSITDVNGDPIIGANVLLKGSASGTVTNISGDYELNVSTGDILVISYIGYIQQEIKLKGEKQLNIVLQEDSQTLNEVVVVGYGTQKKVNLTGAVEQVTSEVFDNRSVPNVTQALQGSIPNLNIKLTDGKPTRSASYNVRGTTSIGQGGMLWC